MALIAKQEVMQVKGLRNLPGRVARLGARLKSDESGLAAVELALVLPFLVLLLAGLVDVSRMVSRNMEVQSAAQAGVDHALRHGWNEPEVREAIVGATATPVAADPAPRLIKGCVSGSTVVETNAPTCATGEPAGDYVAVSASAAFEPLLPWPGIALNRSLSASIVSRIR